MIAVIPVLNRGRSLKESGLTLFILCSLSYGARSLFVGLVWFCYFLEQSRALGSQNLCAYQGDWKTFKQDLLKDQVPLQAAATSCRKIATVGTTCERRGWMGAPHGARLPRQLTTTSEASPLPPAPTWMMRRTPPTRHVCVGGQSHWCVLPPTHCCSFLATRKGLPFIAA